jgi:hypothetical protein
LGDTVALIDRHRVNWTGFLGSPGISTFYIVSTFPMNVSLRAFFASIVAYLPSDVTLTFDASGDTLDSVTGALVGTWGDVAVAPVTGSDAAAYSGVSGALVRWVTNAVLSGRKLKGHTFLVPFGGGQYDTSGQILSATVTAVSAAAASLASGLSGTMLIWERPRLARAAYTDRRGVTHPAITSRVGGAAAVQTASCRAVVTELRSRRD